MRPPREFLHMQTAFLWAERSLCRQPDRKIAAVITTGDLRQVLSIGYNGPAKGLPNDYCRGEQGSCGCLHAEENAIARVNSTIPDKAIFTKMQPCEMCAQLIVQANISKVYYSKAYRNNVGLDVLYKCGIEVHQMVGQEWVSVPERFLEQALAELRCVHDRLAVFGTGTSSLTLPEIIKQVQVLHSYIQSWKVGV